MVISIDSISPRRSQVSAANFARLYKPHSRGGAAVIERRCEPRYALDGSCGVTSILGDPDSRTLCRIVDVSRTGLRIRLNTPFPVGAQVNVQYGERFFVGDCCYSLAKGDGYVLGLSLLASNYAKLPGRTSFALGRLLAFCRAKVKDSLT